MLTRCWTIQLQKDIFHSYKETMSFLVFHIREGHIQGRIDIKPQTWPKYIPHAERVGSLLFLLHTEWVLNTATYLFYDFKEQLKYWFCLEIFSGDLLYCRSFSEKKLRYISISYTHQLFSVIAFHSSWLLQKSGLTFPSYRAIYSKESWYE